MNKLPLKTNSGFLLVEAIIAITILVMVAATSISLLVMGHRAVNVNEHSLEASWLAQEAAESLRGLRDTNWIRYGFDKDNCWANDGSGTCDPPLIMPRFETTIGNTAEFFMSTSLTGAPLLEQAKEPLDLDAGASGAVNPTYLLYYQDLDKDDDYDGDGITDNDKQYIGPASAGYTVVEETKYYREIVTSSIADGHIEATVTVGWYEGSKPHKIQLPVTLTNYQLEE